jgi:HK97 family phage prohead protease
MSTGTLSHKLCRTTISKGLAPRQFIFVISSPTMDRDRDIIKLDAWNLREYEKNPVVLASHDHQRLPVGKSIAIGVRGDKLKATVEFPPVGIYEYADTVHDMVAAGFLNAASVGFRADDSEPNGLGGMTIKQATLLEWSICSIGSNPDAMVERAAPLMMQKWLKSTAPHFNKESTMYATDEPYLEVSDDFSAKNSGDAFDEMCRQMLRAYSEMGSDKFIQLMAAQLIENPEACAAVTQALQSAGVYAPKSWAGDDTIEVDDEVLATCISRVVVEAVGTQTRAALYQALGRLD